MALADLAKAAAGAGDLDRPGLVRQAETLVRSTVARTGSRRGQWPALVI